MKTYMPLNGLRWSRNSGSANCDMPQSAVFGRPGGGVIFVKIFAVNLHMKNKYCGESYTQDMVRMIFISKKRELLIDVCL